MTMEGILTAEGEALNAARFSELGVNCRTSDSELGVNCRTCELGVSCRTSFGTGVE